MLNYYILKYTENRSWSSSEEIIGNPSWLFKSNKDWSRSEEGINSMKCNAIPQLEIINKFTYSYSFIDIIQVPENVKPPPQLEGMDGLAGALARALAERSKAINPESSSSDDDDGDAYDEDEWE